jgi:hypothetical protein
MLLTQMVLVIPRLFSKKVSPLFRLTSMETSLMHRKGVGERRPWNCISSLR